MARARYWPLAALWLAALCSSAWAQTLETVTEDSSYSYIRDGKVDGAASRIVEAVLKQAGLNDYHMGIYPWARAYDVALREPNVLIYPILRSADRERLFKWIGQFDLAKPVFYKLSGAPGVSMDSLEDAKRYRVGVVRDDYREKFLHDMGFTRLVVSANNQENFNRLLNGQVQLVPMPERDARKLCADSHVPFETLDRASSMEALTKEIYLAFSLATDDDTVQRARVAFEQLKADGTLARLLRDTP